MYPHHQLQIQNLLMAWGSFLARPTALLDFFQVARWG
jgi:hypothetical protein